MPLSWASPVMPGRTAKTPRSSRSQTGTGADQTHVSAEDIPQLGQFVQFSSAQETSETGDDRGIDMMTGDRVGAWLHGAKFIHNTGLLVSPNALLVKERGPGRKPADSSQN